MATTRTVSGVGMQPVMVRMPPDLYEAVKRDAEAEDRTMAQTIRRAVKQYIEQRQSSD